MVIIGKHKRKGELQIGSSEIIGEDYLNVYFVNSIIYPNYVGNKRKPKTVSAKSHSSH